MHRKRTEFYECTRIMIDLNCDAGFADIYLKAMKFINTDPCDDKNGKSFSRTGVPLAA